MRSRQNCIQAPGGIDTGAETRPSVVSLTIDLECETEVTVLDIEPVSKGFAITADAGAGEAASVLH